MKAVRFHTFGGPEVLRYEDVPRPEAGAGEVLVRIRAAGVNPVDWKIRAGYMREMFRDRLPMIPGVDMAGVVEEVGGDITGFKAGDKVYGFLGVAQSGGTYAEYCKAGYFTLAPMPESLDFTEAAALPLVSLVGWQTLFDIAHLDKGQTVLIHGASGGVGHMAVQLAKWRGATVIGTASARNADFLSSLGADEVIDYHKVRFEDVARDVDVVLDTQAGDTQQRSYHVLKKGGILVSTLGIENPDEAAKCGVRATGFLAQPNGTELRHIARLIDEGKLKPAVSTVMPLRDAARAHEQSQTGHVRGKIVLKVGD
ncbi:predicted NADPH:quinone reductase (alcohol dehydrogenase superfamily) [Methanocella arvoryzae MRE50]|uniref:Predicted NADPH:quinone reductase (Alcohol dehydrogenase superfamily) n=2 Tax=Methanocella TaxID=570266 RepID=Q0W1R5_METAR|nr:predicted NADPH:quinone reductase (alcohol dehydrogenase superfamily) [Methanocella arvoryzae MRE50]